MFITTLLKKMYQSINVGAVLKKIYLLHPHPTYRISVPSLL